MVENSIRGFLIVSDGSNCVPYRKIGGLATLVFYACSGSICIYANNGKVLS